MEKEDGRRRAVIERITPHVDGGRFAVKRCMGESVTVEADVFCDGHDLVACALQYRRDDELQWHELPMAFLGDDRWRGELVVVEIGRYWYRVVGWIDHARTWWNDLKRRIQAEDIAVALQVGAQLASSAAKRAAGRDAEELAAWSLRLVDDAPLEQRLHRALENEFVTWLSAYPDRRFASFSQAYPLTVERERARYSSWYELFPRSCVDGASRHGTFVTAAARLPYVASLGFDVIYLPPLHPIGMTHRKGRNNALVAGPDDPGSPWAIGASSGGHKAIHPALGTLDEFDHFVAEARKLGLEVALDIAFQCSPDHPYVTEHAEWFARRPDGSIQYAENPPKKYEDIYPFHFESEAWWPLWEELKSIVLFWAERGIAIFRVDNPHTKPFLLWEWLIQEVKREYPQAIFLAEAFARPRVMQRLAKIGFTQSYTYFTWRNTKSELMHYLTELTRQPMADYFIPNLWPNTPDILPEYLQYGGRPAFMARVALAATLSSNYGIYGPAFELLEEEPRTPGSEEYLNSEKYEIRHWELDRPESLADFIARINRIRRENSALHTNRRLRFLSIDNDALIAYSKQNEEGDNVIVAVVNLDPSHTQSGWLHLPLEAFRVDARQPYQAHDLITGARHLWHGERNYVELDPQRSPVHLFRLRRRLRREQDFEYFM